VNRCFGYGLRVSQLSYNFRTRVADGAFEPFDGGVSEYGGKVIDRMNSIGMAVDLGHASDKTKLEAIEISNKPVILSHGNCRALNPSAPRDTTDDIEPGSLKYNKQYLPFQQRRSSGELHLAHTEEAVAGQRQYRGSWAN